MAWLWKRVRINGKMAGVVMDENATHVLIRMDDTGTKLCYAKTGLKCIAAD